MSTAIDKLVEEIIQSPTFIRDFSLPIKERIDDLDDHINQRISALAIEIIKSGENNKNNSPQPQIIEIKDYREERKIPDENKRNLERQHEKFSDLLKLINLNIPAYIYGPTGSGKTMACEIAAEILNIPFYRKVVSSQSSEGVLFGFNNATAYVEGIAYKAYKDGGLLLVDEIDNGNPNINVCLKMLTEGETCYFPCGVVNKHKDFRLVANANTIGVGANRQYVGRVAQDAALLNIFGFIQWDYDTNFEYDICAEEYLTWKGEDVNSFNEMIRTCWKMRNAIERLNLKHIISPRNLKAASRLLATACDLPFILNTVILRGLETTQASKVLEEAKKATLTKDQHEKTREKKALPPIEKEGSHITEKYPRDEKGNVIPDIPPENEGPRRSRKELTEQILEEMDKIMSKKEVKVEKEQSFEDLQNIFVKNINEIDDIDYSIGKDKV